MFFLTNNEVNTFALYTGRYLESCTMRYTDLATMTEHTADLTVLSQNDRYAELTWDIAVAAEGQYILELMDGEERVVTHVAYIANSEDDILEHNDITFYDA